MSSASTTFSAAGTVKSEDYQAGARAAYEEYVAESTAAYQKYLAGLAAARAAEPSGKERPAGVAESTVVYRQYPGAVRGAGLTAIWAAGLTAARAATAYYKYVAGLAVVRAVDLAAAQPAAEPSNAERAAAAAAESAAAYQKYVAADRGTASTGKWSPAV